ncbi:unnamed protein product [Thelazia callipaeda]|uniref:FABP domain-containing protein n=1 Tax=Thelazia callipaeda TaxID=103827 RepID=A0A0N5D4F8_THECL|nr:unnamed protein product [Thelazia callipaeda]
MIMLTGLILIALVTVTIEVQSGDILSRENVQALPEEFLGTFKLERDENFEPYLEAKGVGWFTRQMIKFASVTKILSKSDQPNRYTMKSTVGHKETLFENWALGEELIAEALDSTQHKITFNVKDNTLMETHVKIADPNEIETYEYRREGDYLIMVRYHKYLHAS